MIGILTFVGTQSHGAALQAYALKRAIADLGYDVEIINYISPEMKKTMESRLLTTNKGVKKLLGSVKRYPIVKKRYTLFENFDKEYLGISSYADSIDYDKYELIVVGSDQVWNMEITGNDLTYMLPENGRYIKGTYAASLGVDNFPEEYERKCIDLISGFSFLNVREKQLKDYLCGSIKDNDIRVVLDPTQLLDRAAYDKIETMSFDISGKYVLVHYPFDSDENWAMIRKIAAQRNAEVVYITNKIKKQDGCRCLTAVSPRDYIGLIKNAEVVVTGSFHTLSFSLIYNKEFYCTRSMIANRNSRLTNLLETAGCEAQLLENYPHEISYSKVNSLLDEQRKRSISILSEMCSKTKEDHKEEN